MSYGYRKGYGYKSYYPYKPYYNNSKAIGIKSIKAANSQNSTINFALKVNYAFSARYDKSTGVGDAAINIYDVLMQSENFRHLKDMYDSVKVNGVNVKINVVDAETSVATANGIKTVNVLTAWDKSGISSSDCEFVDGSDNEIMDGDYDTEKAVKYRNTIGSKIAGYGSVNKGLLNQYQKFTRFEKCWPTTQDEKSCYIPTTTFNDFNTGFNANDSYYQISGDYSGGVVSNFLLANNPCIPFENVAIRWKPTLLVGVFKSEVNTTNGSVDQYGDCGVVLFNAEFTIPCTFKGLKGMN